MKFYDKYSNREFVSTFEKKEIRSFVKGKDLTLNDFYLMVGLSPIETGDRYVILDVLFSIDDLGVFEYGVTVIEFSVRYSKDAVFENEIKRIIQENIKELDKDILEGKNREMPKMEKYGATKRYFESLADFAYNYFQFNGEENHDKDIWMALLSSNSEASNLLNHLKSQMEIRDQALALAYVDKDTLMPAT